MRSHYLEFEFEAPDNDAEDGLRVLKVEAEVKVSPYDAGCCSGPPESCYPPEGGEVEIDSVKIDGKTWEEKDWPQGLTVVIEYEARAAEEKATRDDRKWGDY